MINHISKNIFFLKGQNTHTIGQSKYDNIKIKKSYTGSYNIINRKESKIFIQRDDLGTKKLFFGLDRTKKIILNKNFLDLSKICDLKTIYSLPRSKITIIEDRKKINFFDTSENENKGFNNLDFIKEFKIRMDNYFKNVKNKHKISECTVCTSGGLDSTIIAYYAKKYFKKVNCITGLILNDKDQILNYNDYLASKKVCKYLGCKQTFVNIKKENIFYNLKKIMYSCQDWRDYNVHCASINFIIAKHLNKKNTCKLPLFTGDFMNEICADYNTEVYNNKKYYKVPNIPKTYKQRFFINGLDSSDREIGVFNYFKISAYQPFSSVYDLYLNIPSKQFNKKNFKYAFNRNLLPKKLSLIVNQKKNRAQSGNDGGILGWFVDNGFDQTYLSNLFDTFFNLTRNWKEKFIISGSYRTK
jgi:asparagine synthetase B (glutamine-hydrolysing)